MLRIYDESIGKRDIYFSIFDVFPHILYGHVTHTDTHQLHRWYKQRRAVNTSQDEITNKNEFEDTKGVISIRKSKTNLQHNGQKKTDKIKLATVYLVKDTK